MSQHTLIFVRAFYRAPYILYADLGRFWFRPQTSVKGHISEGPWHYEKSATTTGFCLQLLEGQTTSRDTGRNGRNLMYSSKCCLLNTSDWREKKTESNLNLPVCYVGFRCFFCLFFRLRRMESLVDTWPWEALQTRGREKLLFAFGFSVWNCL